MTLIKKITVLIIVLSVFIALGVGAFYGLLELLGLDPGILINQTEQLATAQSTNAIRWGLALNHFISFILGALFLGWIYSGKRFTSYAPIKLPLNIELLIKLILLLLLCYPFAGLLGYLTKELSLPEWMNLLDDKNMAALKMLLNMGNVGELALNILIIGVIPAIGEEMLFRGVIQNELQKSFTNKYLPLIVTSFIFAAFHMEINGLLPKMVIGLVLGFAYLNSGNLLYPMVLHLLNNAVQVIMVYFTGTEQLSEDVPPMSLLQAALITMTLPIIYWYVKYLNQTENGSST